MFTGIVGETGRVEAFERGDRSWRLAVEAPRLAAETALGDSIAVNGCCLTAVESGGRRLVFDVLEETRRLTNLSALRPGSQVNLEGSLKFGGKAGGHLVSGHIDGTGVVEGFEPRGVDRHLRVKAPAGGGRYLVGKGSVAVNGVSLTVAEVDGDRFAVWLVPHTLSATNLASLAAGHLVNIEFDLLGKYVEKLLGARTD